MLSKKGARPLAKHGGRPRARWWSGVFVVGLSGGGSFGGVKEMVGFWWYVGVMLV